MSRRVVGTASIPRHGGHLSPTAQFEELVARSAPVLALAPMQDVTDLPFMRLMMRYGGADLYFTEYFRVHADSKLHPAILRDQVITPGGTTIAAIHELEKHGLRSMLISAIETATLHAAKRTSILLAEIEQHKHS